MPLVPDDFLLGTEGGSRPGELDPAWFPVPEHLAGIYSDSPAYLRAALAAWIAEGTMRTDGTAGPAVPEANRDTAVAAWAYFRAYTDLLNRLSADPASVRLDDLGTSYLAKQMELLQGRRDGWLLRYEAVAAPLVEPAAGFGSLVMTRPTPDLAEYARARAPYPAPGY